MAPAALTNGVQEISLTGLDPQFENAVADGNYFPLTKGNRTFFVAKNGGASPVTVTIDSQKACNQGGDHDGGGSVPAGGERWFGPLETERFKDTSGNCQITYSDVTSVTVAAICVGPAS